MDHEHNFFRERLDLTTIVMVAIGALILSVLISIAASQRINDRVDDVKSNIVIENPFDKVVLEARAAIVWDIAHNRPLYEHNAKSVEPLASLTKLVTTAVALESVPDSVTVSITPDDIAVEGDSGLKSHERWNIKELLKTVLVSSSNDGARAVANVVGSTLPHSGLDLSATTNEKAFVSEMNDFSKKIGLEQTYFKNEHGLDLSEDEAGAFGSATDMAKLFAYVYKNHPDVLASTAVFEVTTYPENDAPHKIKNTNPSVNLIPGIVASKTGFTDLAGGNVAVITSPGMEGPFAIVVLGSSYDGRFTDLEKLSRATLEYVEKNR